MTAKNCFKGKIALGRVSKRAGAKMLGLMAQAERAAAAGDRVAADEAARQAQMVAAHDAARKQAVTLGTIRAQSDMLRVRDAYEAETAALRAAGKAPIVIPFAGLGAKEGHSILGQALASLFVRDPREIGLKWNNVDILSRTLRGEAHAKLGQLVEAMRPKMLGLKREVLRESDFLAALFGEKASPDGQAFARAFSEVAEDLRQKHNAAAGYEAIPKRADWRIGNPTFEPAKVAAMPQEEFVRTMGELLDRKKMIDFRTGQAMTDDRFKEVLGDVWINARMDGAEGAPNAGFVGGGPLSERHSAQRALTYKDSAAWEKARELFGDGTGPFNAAMHHIAAMTRDTAVMRVLGPDPAASLRFMHSMFDREGGKLMQAAEASARAGRVVDNRAIEASVRAGRAWVDTLYGHMTGEAMLTTNPSVARAMANARQVLMSAQLGTSIAAAVTDLGLVTATARFNGLPLMSMMRGLVDAFATKGFEIHSAQAGLVLDTLIHGAGEADRYVGETIRTGIPAKMSTAVIRGIGHRLWTGKLRDAFALETMANLANFLKEGRAFDALDPKFKGMLERYGVDAGDWAKLKAVPLWEPQANAAFLRPMDVRAAGEGDLADALGRMVHTEMHYTAIEGDALTRAIMYGHMAPGSLSGEAARAFWMYKSWPMTILTTQLARSLARGWDGSRLGHLGFALAAMTMFGALATQVKQITAGKDPLNMDASTPEGRQLWLKSFIQGGGLGLLSDVAFSDTQSSGASLLSAAGGPIGGAAADAVNWARGNIARANKGEPTNFLGDAYWVAARYAPGGNLIYGRAAIQHALLDQLGKMADPRAAERFDRMETRARNEFHQDYWWRPGHASPERGPNLGAMFGR